MKQTSVNRIAASLALLSFLPQAALANGSTPAISGLSDLTVLEQDAPTVIDADVSISDGLDFTDGSITFSLADAETEDNFGFLSDSNPNDLGALSLDGIELYRGNGTGRDRIGSVDATNNGEDGAPLTILFSSPLENSSFETGTTEGWTTFASQYPNEADIDGDSINWVRSSNSTSGTATIKIASSASVSYSISVVTSPVSQGTYALRLFSSGSVSCTTPGAGLNPDGYCSTHGPYVESTPFNAFNGDQIFMDWSAQNGGDWYEVLGYLIGDGADDTFGTGDDTETLLFSQRGDTQSFTTTSATVSTDDTYLFRFVSGSYDASGGLALGASLYVDNVRVIGSVVVTDAIALEVARRVTFENTSDNPPSDPRVLTVSATDVDGDTGTATSNITIIPVDDPPTITSNGGGSTATVSVAENQTAVTTVVATDPDSSGLSYQIVAGGDAASFSINASTGVLTFVTAPDYETKSNYSLTVQATANSVSGTQSLTVNVTDANEAPEITTASLSAAVEEQPYAFTVIASDPETGSLIWNLTTAPAFLSIDTGTGQLSGTPASSDTGTHTVVINVSDGSFSDSASFSLEILPDLDGDSIPDDDDDDKDGDGLPNTWEILAGFDASDSSDAALDSDGDGLSNLQEYQQDKNPQLDDVAPEITLPADVTVDATERFNQVDFGTATAYDFLDGDVAVTTSHSGRFTPGRHEIVWTAIDNNGNTATATQIVKVRPLVEFSKDQRIGETGGPDVVVGVHLNGNAADYPVTVPFAVTGTAANPDDHDLQAGTVTISSGTHAEITFTVVDDGSGDDDETIELSMGTPINAKIGPRSTHTTTLSEQNEPPTVALTTSQMGSANLSLIAMDGGDVTVTATVTDPNSEDTHAFDWADSDNSLVDTDSAEASFTFNPSALAEGVYTIQINVSDDGSPSLSSKTSLKLKIQETLPTLSALDDTDGDGIDDVAEGLIDSDSDGIPDYLDAMEASNVIQERRATSDSYVMETNPGLRLRLGSTALGADIGASGVQSDDIETQQLQNPDSVTNVGGYFDFEVSELPEPGQTVQVVLAQFAAIPELPVYRKLSDSGWHDFVENGVDSLASAPGEAGYCPPPGDSQYTEGLTPGHWCVQLTMQDGGPNDADDEVNGTLADPGGVGSQVEVTAHARGGAGAMNWREIAAFVLAMLILNIRNRHLNHPTSRSMALLIVLLGLTPILSPVANADSGNEGTGDTPWKKLQGGFQIAWVDHDDSLDSVNARLQQAGLNATASQEDSSSVGWSVFLAYPIIPRLNVEVGYTRLGEVETDITGLASSSLDFIDSLGTIQPQTAQGLALSATYAYPVGNQWSVLARLGGFAWHVQYNVSTDSESREFKDDGFDMVYGLGVERQIGKRMFVNLLWQRYPIEDADIDSIGLGLRYTLFD
ncbi:MAG: cadherin domain-containing protein [Hahellaceae bacterium]|nr:cadherin domain-containing protein [Hahellaceae bacterium]